MMTQSVMTQAANLFGNASGSVTLKGKQTGSGFEQMINNLKVLQSASGKMAATARKTSVQEKDESIPDQSDDAGGITQQTNAAQVKTAAAADDTDAAKRTQASQPDDATVQKADEEDEAEPAMDEQLLSQILGMLEAICEAVMDKLNLSPEELNRLLEDQGMTVTDLLEPQNLQKLVLADSGETNLLAVLTNEELAGTMNDLLEQVEGMKAASDLQLSPEQVKELLKRAQKMTRMTPGQEALVLPEDTGRQAADVSTEKQQEAVNSAKVKSDEDAITADGALAETADTGNAAKTQVSGESNSGARADTGKKDSKDMKTSEQFQSFTDNLVKASKDVEFNGNPVQAAQLREIANQIIDRIKISITSDQSSMELQLNPENLGKVNLTVQARNGVMTAQFVVQNELSKEAIESQLSILRETLNQQGIKVEAIEVTVSANAFEQGAGENSQSQTDTGEAGNGRQITLEEAQSMTETPEAEDLSQDIQGIVGSRIDYTA
jgi:flagellar hook-length control protein FliK